MKDELIEIRIPDLDVSEHAELTALLPGFLRMDDSPPTNEVGRDIATSTAIVTVTLAVLRVLALWISRRVEMQECEVSVQTRRKDGSMKTTTFRSKSSSTRTEADVMKQLAAACGFNLDNKDAPGGDQS